jgi:hypothetical protein
MDYVLSISAITISLCSVFSSYYFYLAYKETVEIQTQILLEIEKELNSHRI